MKLSQQGFPENELMVAREEVEKVLREHQPRILDKGTRRRLASIRKKFQETM